jgi:hypothetical protein
MPPCCSSTWLALTNPNGLGERRSLLKAELDALRLARVGGRCRGQRGYLWRLALVPAATGVGRRASPIGEGRRGSLCNERPK